MTGDEQQTPRRANGEGSVFWREDRQRWVVQFVYDSFTSKHRRTTKSFKTEKEANKHLNKLLRDQELGLPPRDEKVRLGEFLDHWLSDIVEPSRRALGTKSSYQENVRLHVKPGLGRLRLVELRPEHVRRFLIEKRDAMYSQSMLDTLMSILRRSLDQAMFEERVHRNVARLVQVPEAIKPTREVGAWTQEETQRFLDKNIDDDYFPLFLLVLMVGLRKGEVLALQWSAIDMDERTLRVIRQVQRIKGRRGMHISEPKGRRKRTLIVPSRCIQVLQEYREQQAVYPRRLGEAWVDHDLVFPSPIGTFIDPRNFNRIMDATCKRAGLKSVGPHAMRHTAATIARALGVDWREIQEMLGHSSDLVTRQTYVDTIPELRREAAEKISRAYEIGD